MERTITERINADRRGVLSALWIVVLFNMLFRDIHEFARPGAIEEFMSMDVPEALLLASGVVLSLFISMIVLSRILPRRGVIWANLVVPALAMGSMFLAAPADLDDIWFLGVEITALLAIMWIAWTWRRADTAAQVPADVQVGTG